MNGTPDVKGPYGDLLDAAIGTAESLLHSAIVAIDDQLGNGFARKNPALVGAFMQTAAIDFHGSMVKLAAQDVRDALYAISNQIDRSDTEQPWNS